MIQACIFDLDGTVLEDEDEYGRAFAAVLKKLGINDPEKYPIKGGIGVEENWKQLVRDHNLKVDKTPEELSIETQKEYIKLLHEVTIRDGFPELVAQVKELGMQTALATSNDWSTVERIFEELKLAEYFDCVVTGEEVRLKKPDPEIFLNAAERLAVDPAHCLVFEDAEAGIKAAKAADMKVIGISSQVRDENLDEADLVVSDFTQVYEFLREHM